MNLNNLPAVLPLLIPIIGMLIPIAFIVCSYLRRRDLLQAWHEQRMAAIAKGIELPPMPFNPDADDGAHGSTCERAANPNKNLLTGLVLMACGLGIGVFLWAIRPMIGIDIWSVGAIPALLGVAFVVYHYAGGRAAAAPAAPDPSQRG
jgi:hypothetical protein